MFHNVWHPKDCPQHALYQCSIWGRKWKGTESTVYKDVPQRIAREKLPSTRVVPAIERGGFWGGNGKELLKSPSHWGPSATIYTKSLQANTFGLAALVWVLCPSCQSKYWVALRVYEYGRCTKLGARKFCAYFHDGGIQGLKSVESESWVGPFMTKRPPSTRVVPVLERGSGLGPEWDRNKRSIPQRIARKRPSSRWVVLVLERGSGLGPEWDRNKRSIPQRIAQKIPPPRWVVLVLERGSGLGPEWDRNKRSIPQRIAQQRPPSRWVVLVLERGSGLGPEWDRNKRSIPQRMAQKRPPSRWVVLVLERGWGLGTNMERNKRSIPQRIAQKKKRPRDGLYWCSSGGAKIGRNRNGDRAEVGFGDKYRKEQKVQDIPQRLERKRPSSTCVVLGIARGGIPQRIERKGPLSTRVVVAIERGDIPQGRERKTRFSRRGAPVLERGWALRLKSEGTGSRTRDSGSPKKTASEKKRLAAAAYYAKNADAIRERRRVQMAEKRAAIKAKRRRSDKPRAKKSKTNPHSEQAGGHTVDTLSAAEREASETLASMRHSRPFQPEHREVDMAPVTTPTHARTLSPCYDYFGAAYRESGNLSSDEESDYEVGVRSISEVARHQDRESFAYHSSRELEFGGERSRRLRFETPEQSRSPSPAPGGPQQRMPSFYEKLDQHMRRDHNGADGGTL
ncbi:hypothetical protein B0H16DRAFT_1696726 [Mycena metata]|uniref:Uncharacterized protein n=1 Tax=Mycena metata TaxID=1033252 RepID=A0AAD7HYS4_9AGAR|nr:hypothetical protein B0H16DRAFT_1696726 [Mycena metata]